VVTHNISIEQLQTTLISIDSDTEDLSGKVKALEDNGLTLAESLVKMAHEKRKPMSKAEIPPNSGTTEQKKLG
jgi:hypothetical protein